jgi:uncharacterized phage-associated protein
MAYEPRALANHLLDVADALGLPLTHMAVHKIAYFAHGWHLAQTGAPLIAEEFEAWEYGPVLPTVYAAFKDAGRQPVRSRAVVFNPVTQQRATANASVAPDDAALIRDVVRAYGRMNALTLSDLTHRPGGPWDRVWNAGNGRVTLGMRIRHDAIRADFLHAGTAQGAPGFAG